MPDPTDHLQAVGDIVQDLRALGLEPVLVGGMALVVLGSRRVTRDFDFVIVLPFPTLADEDDEPSRRVRSTVVRGHSG